MAAKSGTLYFEVACDEKETFLSDNYGYLMAGQGSDDDDDWDVSPSPTASSTPNPVSTSLPSATRKPSETPKPTDKQNPTITPTNKPTVQPTKRPNHNKPVVKAPAKVRGVKVKNLKGRKMKVSWSWDITDGYQIQYAMNRKFTKKKKTVTLNSWMSKKTFKHLKKKKTYYVRVRAFRKSGSVKKYGKWSAVKKIKIKK